MSLPLTLLGLALVACGRSPSQGAGSGATSPGATAAFAKFTVVAGDGQTAPSGTALPTPLVVALADPVKGPLVGATVTFTPLDGGGTCSPSQSLTDGMGRAQTTLTLGADGLNIVMVSAPGFAQAPARFNETATFNGAPLAGSTNPLDVAALVALQANGVEPVALSNDDEFLRRVTSDLVGRLPTVAERAAFVSSASPNKRAAKIDQLLATDEFATHWSADVIAPWLGVASNFQDDNTNTLFPFDPFLFTYVQQDTPISQLVQDLASATGPAGAAFDENFALIYSDTTAVDHLMLGFTGMTSKCARCHDHPLTTPQDDPKWVQDDNYALYAFVAATPDVCTKVNKAGVRFGNPVQPAFVVDGYANAPSGLPTLADPVSVRRAAFGQLLSQSHAFRRGTAHRIWTEIASPLLNPDQFLAGNLAGVPAPALLAALTQTFTDEGTQLKGFLRVCMNSNLYQLGSTAKDTKADPFQGRYVLRRNHAEVVLRGDYAIAAITTGTDWTSLGTQASLVPLVLPVPDVFALNFGYPIRYTTATNTQRSDAPSMQQELIQLNTQDATNGIVAQPGAQTATLAALVDKGSITFADAVNALFRSSLSRDATPGEVALVKAATVGAASTQEALEDAAVAITGSAEFMFRH